ncbi:MAG: methylated-DNA--[protein]-cysteine S-methyltransferase [Halochromatium sp.]|nr:methylated-DNA--[protein]-cysteine S-methyltransferase [Halochromatium sp.]
MYDSQLATPFGVIGISWQDQRLTGVLLRPEKVSGSAAPAWLIAELEAYFADPGHRISCAIELEGTAFQGRVWALIAAIPSGSRRTYGALAKELGSSARAVGNACRANPVPLRIPCHRVVSATGLGGFAGDRDGRLLAIKRWLLDHEAGLRPAPLNNTGDARLTASRPSL